MFLDETFSGLKWIEETHPLFGVFFFYFIARNFYVKLLCLVSSSNRWPCYVAGASKEVNEWRLESLEQLQESSSDEEYFDAQGKQETNV